MAEADDSLFYKGYKIVQTGEEFKVVRTYDGVPYITTRFIAIKGDESYDFSFGVGTITLATQYTNPSKAELIEAAIEIIKAQLDEGNLEDGKRYDYGYGFDAGDTGFALRENPAWVRYPGK